MKLKRLVTFCFIALFGFHCKSHASNTTTASKAAKQDAEVERLLHEAQQKKDIACKNKSSADCYEVAKATALSGDLIGASVLALSLCQTGEMDSLDPCEWYWILDSKPIKRQLMEHICALTKNRQACIQSVGYMMDGKPMPKKLKEKQLRILKSICEESSYPKACSRSGEVLILDDHYKEAVAPLQKACDANLAFSCTLLASALKREQNLKGAEGALEKACLLDKKYCKK